MGFSRQEYWSGVPLPSPNSTLVPLINMNFILYLLQLLSFMFIWLRIPLHFRAIPGCRCLLHSETWNRVIRLPASTGDPGACALYWALRILILELVKWMRLFLVTWDCTIQTDTWPCLLLGSSGSFLGSVPSLLFQSMWNLRLPSPPTVQNPYLVFGY